jgi:hypothetical protein
MEHVTCDGIDSPPLTLRTACRIDRVQKQNALLSKVGQRVPVIIRTEKSWHSSPAFHRRTDQLTRHRSHTQEQ